MLYNEDCFLVDDEQETLTDEDIEYALFMDFINKYGECPTLDEWEQYTKSLEK